MLFEGKPVGTPDAGAFWRIISQHKVACLFTAPTAFRAIKRDDPNGELIKQYDLASFRTLFLAGERLDSDTLRWAHDLLKVPVLDHWWQTETGWAICANCVGLGMLPVKPGSAATPVPGWDVQVLDARGRPAKPGETGALVCKLPLPPGSLTTLWNADSRYRESYLAEFPGYYTTGDAGFVDKDGYVFVMTRTDDVINVSGHRLSTGAIEEVLASHADIAECAVIGVADQLKGQVPVGFLVLKSGVAASRKAEIVREVVQMVRERIGPVAAFKTATVVKRLPKTRSGKILRGIMNKIADSTSTRCRPPSMTLRSSRRSRKRSGRSGTREAARDGRGHRRQPRLVAAIGIRRTLAAARLTDGSVQRRRDARGYAAWRPLTWRRTGHQTAGENELPDLAEALGRVQVGRGVVFAGHEQRQAVQPRRHGRPGRHPHERPPMPRRPQAGSTATCAMCAVRGPTVVVSTKPTGAPVARSSMTKLARGDSVPQAGVWTSWPR